RQVVVHRQLAGVDDAHGQAGANGVVEEHRVDGLAHRVVAPKGKGHIADAAGNQAAGQMLPNPGAGLDKIEGIVVVLLDPGGHGEHIGVENNIAGLEAKLVDQDV